MSTRGIVCAVKGGNYKIALYNHCDSYPSYLGEGLLEALKNKKLRKNLLLKMDSIAGIKESESSDAIDILKGIASGEITEICNDLNFAGDSLFCEWGYVIDFDRKTFEIYRGFNQQILPKGERFAFCNDAKSSYRPIKMIDCFHFSRLPKNLRNYEI